MTRKGNRRRTGTAGARRPGLGSGRRAFATVTAVGMIAVVSIALTAMTVLFARGVQRNIRQAEDAQLRQLLIAGQVAVAAAPQAGKADVPLPGDLQSAGAALAYDAQPEAGDGAGLSVTVTARLGSGRSMTQTLHFAREGERWVLRSAEL